MKKIKIKLKGRIETEFIDTGISWWRRDEERTGYAKRMWLRSQWKMFLNERNSYVKNKDK